MKKITLQFLSALIITCLVSSCNKDLDTQTNELLTLEENTNEESTPEETLIPASILETGIQIGGASVETGTPPAPNSNINFELNTDLKQAFQSTGLNIEFSSTESIAGAYILFKDLDGNVTRNYFNVPASAFNPDDTEERPAVSRLNNESQSNRLSRRAFQSSNEYAENSTTENDVIEIDFSSDIPAGQFCYDICIYDAQGNVSQIETVCVTVEAWGGNALVVGEWELEIERYNDYTTVNCQNGNTLEEVEDIKYIRQEIYLVLNEDGTYQEIFDEEYRVLDYPATEANCSIIYGDYIHQYHEKYSGNWAFNEENQSITLIDFKYEDLLDSSNNAIYIYEEGLFYFEATVEVTTNQLILTTPYNVEDFSDDDEDFIIDEDLFIDYYTRL